MSATRDKTQKITFVYSNLYAIYRKGVERARDGAIQESGGNSPSAAAEALTELASVRGPQVTERLAPLHESGLVIKARDLRVPAQGPVQDPRTSRAPGGVTEQPQSAPQPAGPRISGYTPAELLGRRVARPTSLAQATLPVKPAVIPEGIASLKQNLQSLNDLQERLRFMLKELEDLVKD